LKPVASKGFSSRGNRDDDEDSWEETDEEGVRWLVKGHASIGVKVAAYFPPLERIEDLVPSHGVTTDSDDNSSGKTNKQPKTESQLFIGMVWCG